VPDVPAPGLAAVVAVAAWQPPGEKEVAHPSWQRKAFLTRMTLAPVELDRLEAGAFAQIACLVGGLKHVP
jgi:hypothetical protein